jgi:hypothetical protein
LRASRSAAVATGIRRSAPWASASSRSSRADSTARAATAFGISPSAAIVAPRRSIIPLPDDALDPAGRARVGDEEMEGRAPEVEHGDAELRVRSRSCASLRRQFDLFLASFPLDATDRRRLISSRSSERGIAGDAKRVVSD